MVEVIRGLGEPLYTSPQPTIPANPGTATFLASGTGSIPVGSTQFRILGIGGGSSGAGGGTVASSGSGGGSGGGGAKVDSGWLPISSLSTLSYSVTIGTGGATASAGSAGNGGANTTVTFGTSVFTFPGASGGGSLPSAGVSGAISTGGRGGSSFFVSNAGGGVQSGFGWIAIAGLGCSATGTPTTSNSQFNAPMSGGAGGGLNSGVFVAGANSGTSGGLLSLHTTSGGATAGANGSNGNSNPNWPFDFDGQGGGGGAGNGAGVGGNGGNGGQPGGGGGGGGSGTTGGGTGGAGGNGAVFIEWM